MLDAKLSAQLQAYLQNLKTEVQLHIALDTSAHPKKSDEISELAKEIAQLSDLVKVLPQQDKHVRVPSMQVVSAVNNTKITFAGVPLGHEFTSLVLALLHSGGHPLKITQEQIEFIKGLEGEFEFETFVSLSCQTCPGVVQALNMMAALNPNIRHTMIDGSLFQDEVTERNIMA
ncbi:MAG: alkyl hydroperoxide reductase subunit F, partial [Paraglaciecola sp.]|nr:alkyl hydroperoxide reductase subunit F [Paraglaciecola sp.]